MLAEATELFSRKGYRAVSIRELARRSGVTLSSLYHHFGDKRGLFLQVHLTELTRSSKRLEAALEAGRTPEQCLLCFATELSRLLCARGPLFRMLARQHNDGEPDVTRELDQTPIAQQLQQIGGFVEQIAPRRSSVSDALSLYCLLYGQVAFLTFAESLPRKVAMPRSPEALAIHALTVVFPHVDWSQVRTR